MTLPDFFVIGGMRCGTSSLNHYLAQHPDICMTPKEPKVFHRGLDLSVYRDLLPATGTGQVCGEASPIYLSSAVAAENLHAARPHARLVVLLRHPADRAYSHYWHDRARERIDPEWDFREAVANRPLYLLRSDYEHHLARWQQWFPPDHFLRLSFEEMVRDPASSYARVCRFLGVDDTVDVPDLGRVVNPYQRFRSVRVRDAARRLHLPLVARVVGRLNGTSSAYPDLSDDDRTWFVERLAAMTGTIPPE